MKLGPRTKHSPACSSSIGSGSIGSGWRRAEHCPALIGGPDSDAEQCSALQIEPLPVNPRLCWLRFLRSLLFHSTSVFGFMPCAGVSFQSWGEDFRCHSIDGLQVVKDFRRVGGVCRGGAEDGLREGGSCRFEAVGSLRGSGDGPHEASDGARGWGDEVRDGVSALLGQVDGGFTEDNEGDRGEGRPISIFSTEPYHGFTTRKKRISRFVGARFKAWLSLLRVKVVNVCQLPTGERNEFMATTSEWWAVCRP